MSAESRFDVQGGGGDPPSDDSADRWAASRGINTENDVSQTVLRPQDMESSRCVSLFQQTWWLEAAGGSALEWARVCWDGATVASLAFVRQKTMGFTTLDMPPYTRTLGPVLALPPSKRARRLRNTHLVVRELITALPRHDRYQCVLDPDDDTAFALALSGCSVGQNFTFRMPEIWSPEQQWLELDQKTRNLIRTAQGKLSVDSAVSIDEVIALSHLERGRKDRSDEVVLHRIADAALARGKMRTLAARDAGGRVAAAATLVWDDRVLYYWQSSRNLSVPVPGANSLLIWEAMLLAAAKGLIFDIDGYHSVNAARFVAKFNMETRVRASVVHMSRRGRVAQALGRLLGRGTGFGVQPISESPLIAE